MSTTYSVDLIATRVGVWANRIQEALTFVPEEFRAQEIRARAAARMMGVPATPGFRQEWAEFERRVRS